MFFARRGSLLLRLARPALAPLRWQPCRALCAAKAPGSATPAPPAEPPKEPKAAEAKPASSAESATAAAAVAGVAAKAVPGAPSSTGAPNPVPVSAPDAKSSALSLSDEEDDAPPPMEWEPGMAGTVQKGLSAVLIAFGAAAFGVCAFGAYWALFPGTSSPGAIFEEAGDKLKMDPEVADRLGTPIKSFGADFGGGEGRRNFVQSWEVEGDDGKPAIQVKFNVQGPQGRGIVHAQAPTPRSRGDFNFIVFEDKRRREVVYVVDNRAQLRAKAQAEALSKAPPPPAAPAAPASVAA
ncbi:hypothetical protein T492DRAFT_976295 [Pavlovales sp. CCMP2436]|nr:hypothetical protein T492DRAFT_976295 [Pavlovales sp. CCMP2436]|mmetsp:Transcript_1538/g.4056  ORF Transcript_1538/g.4056 Transcript_1538/m.4056 type:complete len:295 (+) Transcript_1538:99-983(+)